MVKRKDYNALIERVKVYARQDPAGYRRRVFLLGLLGYAYILLILSLLVAMTAFVIWWISRSRRPGALVQILGFLLLLIFLILKSLWIRLGPPIGHVIRADEAPKLFAAIREICAKQNCRLPNEVILTSDFNAFVSQVPRLGIFGWHKNYLALGLPYMLASDIKQFKAVLAHEFGHFSGHHGWAATWIYRIRSSWFNIMESMRGRSVFFLFRLFFDRYLPYFNAYSFVLAREQEYEADRYATTYAGTLANAEDLVNTLIKSGATAPSWDAVWKRADNEPEPPKDTVSKMTETLKYPIPQDQYRDDLERALKRRTQNLDTHPCLKERLSALGYRASDGRIVDAQGQPLLCQKVIDVSAAHAFLSEKTIAEALRRFDEDWYRTIESSWKERYAQIQKMKQELADLNQKAASGLLDEDATVRRAYLIDETASRVEAIPAIMEVIDRYPRNAAAHYRLGEILIEKYDPKGVELLKQAMQLDGAYTSACLDKISSYRESRGEYEGVEGMLDSLDRSAENDEKDIAERSSVTSKDRFKGHGLDAVLVNDLVLQLNTFKKELHTVYLVQKEMQTYPQQPMYVLVVKRYSNPFLWEESSDLKLVEKLAKTVQIKLVRGSTYFHVEGSAIIRKAKKIPAALIWARKNHKGST